MSAKTQKRLLKWSLFAGTVLVGLLPGGCETMILRAVTPLFL